MRDTQLAVFRFQVEKYMQVSGGAYSITEAGFVIRLSSFVDFGHPLTGSHAENKSNVLLLVCCGFKCKLVGM